MRGVEGPAWNRLTSRSEESRIAGVTRCHCTPAPAPGQSVLSQMRASGRSGSLPSR